MSITSTASDDGTELTIKIDGKFDYRSHDDFRSAYINDTDTPTDYKVDMSNAIYVDSSALGMLLLLRNHANDTDAHIEIVNCSDEVLKVFTISNFDSLFEIL